VRSINSTIARLQAWPAAVNVPPVAEELGVSRATLYAAIARGDAPIRTIRVAGRIKVLTQSLIDLLEADADHVTGREMASDQRRSETMPEPRTSLAVKCVHGCEDPADGGFVQAPSPGDAA
jgi:predicted DNA-binding transcriptional regulator AlpA